MSKDNWKENVNGFIEYILNRYAFSTYEDTGKILVYIPEEGIYKDAEPTINYECCNWTSSEGINTLASKAMVEMNIKGRTYRTRHNYNNAVCLNNGILEFEDNSFKILPFTSKLVFESKVKIDYVKGKKCPVWEATVNNMLPNESDRLLLQEWFGYHFIPGQPYEKAMFITGKPSTGKSTTINVLNELLGGCCAHHQLSEFQIDTNYAKADLYSKLGNTYTDMGNTVVSDVGIFKVLTGSRDTISARFPYEKPFNFLNSAKLTFASNKLPPLSASVQGDQAFWKRVLLLEFSEQIKTKDPEIFKKLHNELSGILNWSLEGYLRLVKNNGKFTMKKDDVYEMWTASAYSVNPLDDFISEMCCLGIDKYCVCNDLRRVYERWAVEHLEVPISPGEFRSALAQKAIFEGRKMNVSLGVREQIYKGIYLL